MATTQNLRVALHIPTATPKEKDVVKLKVVSPYETEYGVGAGGGGTPRLLQAIIPDGVKTTFAGVKFDDGLAMTPKSHEELLVSVGGVVQYPGVDFQVVGSDIVFSVAPHLHDQVFAIWYDGGGGGGVGTTPANPLPVATKEGQVIASGAGPAFAWQAEDFDQGRY